MSTTQEVARILTKEEVCSAYFTEKTRINAETAALKKTHYKNVDTVLSIGELVTFFVGGKLVGVKKSPTTKMQVSQTMLRDSKRLTVWKQAQKKAERIQRELDEVMDHIRHIEEDCQIPIEVGYSIKTIINPKVA